MRSSNSCVRITWLALACGRSSPPQIAEADIPRHLSHWSGGVASVARLIGTALLSSAPTGERCGHESPTQTNLDCRFTERRLPTGPWNSARALSQRADPFLRHGRVV